jgi:hypothetical protein
VHGKFLNPVDPQQVQDWSLAAASIDVELPKSYMRSNLSGTLLSELKKAYSLLYPHANLGQIDINSMIRKYSSIICQGMKFSSKSSRSIVYATTLDYFSTQKHRPVLIQYFAYHAFRGKQHLFAIVTWLKEHLDKDHFVKPLEVWWKDLDDPNLNAFVPVQLLICHSVYCEIKYEEQAVYLMCPVQNI